MLNEPQNVIALSQGDPAGIGPDISLFAWINRVRLRVPPFLYIGSKTVLLERADQLNVAVSVQECTPENAASAFTDHMPLLSVECLEKVVPGQPSSRNAECVIKAIETAVELIQEGRVSSMVTNPIAKSVLYDAGFTFPGHTEFLADLASHQLGQPVMPVMLLAGPELKTVPVTIHIPLRDVPIALTQKLITDTCRIVHRDLVQRFGISNPKLAVAGLNPHAGENGALGHEDANIIMPAVQELVAQGIHAIGPLPADTMFHARARETYDVAICMYHDQALIPAKALGFDDAVNVTLGLPFIRTSPDHGTAFSLAGKGVARADSLIAALKLANELSSADKGGVRGDN